MTNEEHRPCQCSKCNRATIADLVAKARSNYKNLIDFHTPGSSSYTTFLGDVVEDLLEAVEAIVERIR